MPPGTAHRHIKTIVRKETVLFFFSFRPFLCNLILRIFLDIGSCREEEEEGKGDKGAFLSFLRLALKLNKDAKAKWGERGGWRRLRGGPSGTLPPPSSLFLLLRRRYTTVSNSGGRSRSESLEFPETPPFSLSLGRWQTEVHSQL